LAWLPFYIVKPISLRTRLPPPKVLLTPPRCINVGWEGCLRPVGKNQFISACCVLFIPCGFRRQTKCLPGRDRLGGEKGHFTTLVDKRPRPVNTKLFFSRISSTRFLILLNFPKADLNNATSLSLSFFFFRAKLKKRL